MKITLINVKYSPNLGDGIIAECIEHQLKEMIETATVTSLDISGMQDYGNNASIVSSKFQLMSLIKAMPKFFLNLVVRHIMPLAVEKKFAKTWSQMLSNTDCMVIGGGQLIMDVDQYFPMRIKLAVNQANINIPLAIYSVGVSTNMTNIGLSMFKSIFFKRKLIFTSVRDENAKSNFITHFNDVAPPVIVRDPGLLASMVYGFGSFSSKANNIIAFGVADPSSLTPHADSREGVVCSDINFYLQTITKLSKNYYIHMFTNGEDYEYLNKLALQIERLPNEVREKVKVLPRALRPHELVDQIQHSNLLIAHRLHANIVAYSHGIPHIGLGWDSKLTSFFESTDRAEFVITTNINAVERLVDLCKKALLQGINKSVHSQVLAEAKNGLQLLANAIRQP